jgi:hypothetical protein
MHYGVYREGGNFEIGLLARATRWLGTSYKLRLSLGPAMISEDPGNLDEGADTEDGVELGVLARIGFDTPAGFAFDIQARTRLVDLEKDFMPDGTDDMLLLGVSTTSRWSTGTAVAVELGFVVLLVAAMAGTH